MGRVEICVLLVGLANAVVPRAAVVALWSGVVTQAVKNEARPAAGDGVSPLTIELVPKEPARLVACHAKILNVL